MIERWCHDVAIVLNQRYTSSLQHVEKRHLQAAISALQNQQISITKNFAIVLTNAMASDMQRAIKRKTEESYGFISSLSFDDLELMGDNQVQDKVDSARVLQTVAMACEAGLAAFTARLSTAQGFAQVKADKNPLRPEIFSQALLKAVQATPVDNAIRSLWFSHGGELMGQQLQALYLALNELLIERGVAPAAYRVVTDYGSRTVSQANISSPIGASRAGAQVSGIFAPLANDSNELPTIAFPQQEAKRNEAPVAAPSRTSLTVNRLRRLLVGDYDESLRNQALPFDSEPIGHREFSHTVPAAVTVLDELEEHAMATPQTHGKALSTLPLPLAQLREHLKLEAKSLGQSLAIEVVSLMIEKMANDPRLLAPVQKIIANAEPAFLRLAVTDPRFFSDKSHPARNLLETIAAKSLAFAHEGAPGFAEFLQDLQDVAALLTEEDASDTQHFANLLAGFEKKVALRHAVACENYRRTTQALLEADQRNTLARKISTEILARADFVFGNRIIAAFLTGPWSQVLAKERLAVDSDKTGMYKAIFSVTLTELLWSLDAEQTASHPNRMARLIPSILENLHGGLLSIDSPLADSKAFFEEVLTIHQSSLKSTREPAVACAERAMSLQDGQTRFELDGLFAVDDSAHDKKLLPVPFDQQQPSSIRDVALRAEPRVQWTQPFLDTAAGEEHALEPQARPLGSIELRLGAWVELIADDQWLRAQLTWISLYGTLFMFTSAGGRTHSMTEPLLQYFLLQGLVKVINQEGVLAGALDQVARTAMHTSVMGNGQASQSFGSF